MTRAPILEGARVNGAIRSRRFALESIVRALSAAVTLFVILVTFWLRWRHRKTNDARCHGCFH